MPPASKIPAEIMRVIPNGQHFITLIKRHLIGLIYIYLIILAAVASLVFLVASLAPDLLGVFSGSGFSTATLVTFLLILLVVIILILVTGIYLHNSLVITDKEIIQILQRGVFQVKVSHLSHADIEDVTAEQSGLLPTVLSYGTLHIETSGELKNFAFSYCPNPEQYAKVVLEARQKFTDPAGP